MRPIDADALLEAIKTDVMGGLNYQHFIEEALTIEPKQGEWVRSHIGTIAEGIFCSNCKKRSYNKTDYCPNCGARMKGVDNAVDAVQRL